ncbi:hypothetical protein ACFYR1_35370 [Streptomyces canus]
MISTVPMSLASSALPVALVTLLLVRRNAASSTTEAAVRPAAVQST